MSILFHLTISEQLKTFLLEFCSQDVHGSKNFKYSNLLTKLAHREQVAMWVELDDVHSFDEELASAILSNTRRYSNMLSDVVFEILPTFIQREVIAKDALDVYIEHRIMMERRLRQPNEHRDPKNKFPPELMKR